MTLNTVHRIPVALGHEALLIEVAETGVLELEVSDSHHRVTVELSDDAALAVIHALQQRMRDRV